MSVYRIFVEKKPAYAVASEELREDLRSALGIELHELHLLNRYDLENLSEETFSYACRTILSEPQVDDTYPACPYEELRVFAVEYLPGQFDQRADSCAQCISLATAQERPLVRTARVYAIDRSVSDQDFERIKQYLINPVASRAAPHAPGRAGGGPPPPARYPKGGVRDPHHRQDARRVHRAGRSGAPCLPRRIRPGDGPGRRMLLPALL